MVARLSVSVLISLLLHAAVVGAFVLIYGKSPAGDPRRPVSGPMVVQFAPAKPTPPSGTGRKQSKPAKPDIPREAPPQALAAQQPSTPFSGRSGFAPQPYQQMQVDIQRMGAAQARMFAAQQQQMTISRLQSNIAQALNRNGLPPEGVCSWQENPQADPDMLKCEPAELDKLVQPEAQQLDSLRKAMRMLGTTLDEFSVTTIGTTATIIYRTRPAPLKR